MRKTLLLTIDYPPRKGGVARYLSALANFFADDLFVIANSEDGDEEVDALSKVKVIRERLFYLWVWPRWIKSVSILLKYRRSYDQVLLSHVLPLGTAALIARWITKKPYLIVVHGMDIRLAKNSVWKRWLVGVVLRGAKQVITNSKDLREEIVQSFSVTEAIVIYPCVPERQHAQSEHDDTNVRLLTVSRLVDRKGHLRVLKALALLKDRGIEHFSYHIVGSGPAEEKIKKQIEGLRLKEIVTLSTNVSDQELETIYATSDVFVMPVVNDPIDKEGFGLVYLEAAQFGLPSIATKMSGVDEAVIDGETGMLVEDGNIEYLTDAILQLVQNESLRISLGLAAKERTETEFSCAHQFEKLKPFL